MKIPRLKYHLRFIIKIVYSPDDITINKLTTFLNQLQVEDAAYIDDLLLEHFNT